MFKEQTFILISAENSLFMIFLNFKLTIYRRYILSSVNSHSPTAIRSIWFKVLSKDFRASTCSLLSVNILFLCPSLSCHICSAMYPLTFLLKGKVCLKHAWSDLLFPALVLDMIRSQCCNIRSKKYSIKQSFAILKRFWYYVMMPHYLLHLF